MANMFKRFINRHLNDKKFSEILTGSSWAVGARILAIFLGFVINIIIARVYGAKALGVFTFVESTLILVTVFTLVGTNTSILRFIPEHMIKYSTSSAYCVYKKILKIIFLMSVSSFIVFFVFSDLIAERILLKNNLAYYLTLLALFIPFKSLLLYNTQALRGLKLIKEFAAIIVLPHILHICLLAGLTFIIDEKDLPVLTFLSSVAIASIVGWGIMNSSFKKRLKVTDIIYDERVSKIFAISLPMLMTSATTYVIGQTGVIFLTIFRTETEVGYYGVAVKMATVTSFILASVNSVIAPKFSELFHSEKIEELFYIAKKSTKLIFWLTLPISVTLLLCGRHALSIFFGADFIAAYPALAVLLFGQFFNSISGSTMLFMNMTNRQVLMRNIIIIAAILQISLSFFLIPKMGTLGAAIAAAASLVFWNLTTLAYLKHTYGKTTGYIPSIR
jgi:O-antigen/teichoic acid export membrane protein